MTHLSDFSYLERCTIWVYISVYLAYSIYKGDKFRCLKPKSIISGELKSIITILLILMIMMQFMWDIVSTYVKYEEGFVVYEGNIITKPFVMWTPTHQDNMRAMDYVECVTFSLQVGVFFLMQSFWNYLSNSVARKSFMGSFEFKFYIVMALASMAMFPVLQWVYREDVNKREGIPQLAYGIEGFVTSLLGIRSHFRFKRIIAMSQRNNNATNKTIVSRLAYFKDMNTLVSIILFSYSVSFIVLCSDGLTEAKVINSSKFATDTIVANVNICTVFLCLCLISIFHPRPQYVRGNGESTNTQNESNFHYPTNNNNNNAGIVRNQSDMNSNYVVNESVNGFASDKFTGSNINTQNLPNNNSNGGFMRAMSPVTVDYPHSLTNDTIPLTASTGTGRPTSPETQHIAYRQQQQQQKARNVAVEDPYNNEPVMFTMMDASNKHSQQRYGASTSPSIASRHDIPMRGMNSMDRSRTISPQQHRYVEEEEDYMDVNPNVGYIEHKQTTAPHKIRRPSWERGNTDINELNSQSSPQHRLGQPEDQVVRDWLWQSPDRRNA